MGCGEKMNQKGILVVVSGPSGAGKGTICAEILKRNDIDLRVSVSATTRQPRAGEVDKQSYFFKTHEEFETMIQNNEFLEYAQVYGNYYGTPKKFVLDCLNKGQNVLLEIDIQGAMQVRDNYPDGAFVFVLPPSMKELKSRILGRGSETTKSFETRFLSAVSEMEYIRKYDYYIVNDELDSAVDTLCAILKAESHKVKEDVEVIVQRFKGEVI